MGQFQPQPQGSAEAEAILQGITQQLQGLQETVAAQLGDDIGRLQQQKQQLLAEITQLQQECQRLQADHDVTLSRQQLAQQQLWAKQLAQALMVQLQARLSQSGATSTLPQTAEQLGTLDASLHRTLQTLQQDLNSYQSSLSQQVSRMHSMEHQGEAILEALVHRLSQQLQEQLQQPLPRTPPSPATHALHPAAAVPSAPSHRDAASRLGRRSVEHLAASDSRRLSPRRSRRPLLGPGPLWLWPLSLALHSVLVGVVAWGGTLGGVTTAAVLPMTWPNLLALVWWRDGTTLLPLTALLAHWQHPHVWQEIRQLWQLTDRRPLGRVLASGGFLFVSLVLCFQGIAQAGPAVAIALLCGYPLISDPLEAFLRGHSPSALTTMALFALVMGLVFTATGVSWPGIAFPLLAAAAYGLYWLTQYLSQLSRLGPGADLRPAQPLHPMTITLLQTGVLFLLATAAVLLSAVSGMAVIPTENPMGFYGAGLGLAGLAVLGHWASSRGPAWRQALVPATVPLLTALLAVVCLPSAPVLGPIQWIGIVLISLGLITSGRERWLRQRPQP
ncbi:Metabolite Transporter protein [Halomicronema hongdechloris C2206]|uniref:Metabolite Transporter protein n=1 Tax=Halomicronema hongdechloris C2206 TaxID=1641165 RepID=A0A1Z3HUV9_9CYAN|nr:DMT family transporter [Halomicronema hongdechloris]ASC74079.1 Metabolite Transporter protein [Halomicronema hongdechloris C2206]